MVRTGLPGRLEHFVAYAGSAAIAMAGYGVSPGAIPAKKVGRNFLISKYRLAIRHFITICLMVCKNRKNFEKIAELYCGYWRVFPQ
jgi:hypothetical protein